ncbi:MAG TPA: hypothetical protein VHJ59_06480 [Nitrososphaera sp.]|nr:hypothetical protein [Nitrososphaera sp.]
MSLQIAKVKGIPIRFHSMLVIAIALISFTLATGVLNVEMERQEIAQTVRKSGSSNSKVSGAIRHPSSILGG